MAFWLAHDRKAQHSSHIQRFDPRFWTVDFPRPDMASVITTAPDALRVDLEFHSRSGLAGLIWHSEDTYDHPLLAYATDKDYARTTLSFRWRSGGIIALDQPNGPTLTLEGRDASGAARFWYVRLWNYAQGSGTDAFITLPFSALHGGWDLPNDADRVDPRQIDRMFLSLTPPGYAADSDALLPERSNGWAELSSIRCEGDRAMLEIGDVLLPPHGIRMATAYDDAYNLTPARLLRSIRGLGYRDEIVHYVGMSHYFRLHQTGSGAVQADPAQTLCTPCTAWHRDYFAKCKAQGYQPIASLSYEILGQHCPENWMQRAADGSPALTGWDPPSALLSPANGAAMAYLQAIGAAFVKLLQDAQLPVRFQIGEPWWWVQPDTLAPCLYDQAARTAFSNAAAAIESLEGPQSLAHQAVLDAAGHSLGTSTRALKNAVKSAAGGAAEVYLLAFTPTVLNPLLPDSYRANLPLQWAWPEFERLQVEDYDWLTEGAEAARMAGYQFVDQRLGYPKENQDYMAGFVLRADQSAHQWPLIDAGLDEAAARGITRLFVWALPQVCRDGFTRLPPSAEDAMQAFDDVLFPIPLGRDAGASPEFSTSVAVTASGHERRSSLWSDARLRFDAGPGVRSEEEVGLLISFFRARRGAARGFRLRDPFDFSSHAMSLAPTAFDQLLGLGDALTARFRLCKRYGLGNEAQIRPITRPRTETIVVSVDGIPANGWTLEQGGWIRFAAAPAKGAQIRAGFLFDVPVRFAEDRLDVTGANFSAGDIASVPLIEVREAV